MRLVFTLLAREDLARLREFIAQHNPEAAHRAAERLKAASRLIADQPLIGRVALSPASPRPDVRDLTVPFGANGYLIRYQVLKAEVRILRIWHAREDWQSTP